MQMFESFLNSIPKNRLQIVNDLEIPDVTLSPYFWSEAEDALSTRSVSVLTDSIDEYEVKSLSTDSSIPLSRAMTDSEIDYGMHRRFKSRSLSDPWGQMRTVLDAFPPGYLDSLNSFQTSSTETIDDVALKHVRQIYYNEELRLKMQKFFDEECRVFTPDDTGLMLLEEALEEVDLKMLNSDLDSVSS